MACSSTPKIINHSELRGSSLKLFHQVVNIVFRLDFPVHVLTEFLESFSVELILGGIRKAIQNVLVELRICVVAFDHDRVRAVEVSHSQVEGTIVRILVLSFVLF